MSPEQARGDLEHAGPAVGRLQPGRDPLLPADRQAAVRGGRRRRGAARGPAGRVPAAAAARPVDRPGAGGRLPEGDGAQARGPLRHAPGAGRGRRAVDGRRAGLRPARSPDPGSRPVVPATPVADLVGRRGPGRARRILDDRRARRQRRTRPRSRCADASRYQLRAGHRELSPGPAGRRRLPDPSQREYLAQGPAVARPAGAAQGPARGRSEVLPDIHRAGRRRLGSPARSGSGVRPCRDDHRRDRHQARRPHRMREGAWRSAGALGNANPGDNSLRIEVAETLDAVGTLQRSLGQLPECLASLGEARAMLEAVVDAGPDGPDAQSLLGQVCSHSGSVHKESEEWARPSPSTREHATFSVASSRSSPESRNTSAISPGPTTS